MQNRLLGILTILLLSCGQLFCQIDIDSLPMVGFACGYSGEPSEAVQKASEVIQARDFDKFTDFLINGNAAEQYLAVVVLQYLDKEEIRTLKDSDKTLIDAASKSRALVAYCAGCLEHRWRIISELLTAQYITDANQWISGQLNIE